MEHARASNRLYRDRNGVMFGDVVGSQPYYVRAANFGYTENNYAGYKISTSTRSPTVYVGANDGMLHAFNALTGVERWAYVPSQVFPTMYGLASADYANTHKFYVDGAPIASDIYCTSCSTVGWRTIIVGGLNAGGNGYYAIDVTDPDDPHGLWEFKTTTTCLSAAEISNGTGSGDCHVGNSYGRPVITKLNDGTWVVLVTSGYNNTGAAGTTGYGYLYVLNAITGKVINRISTNVGSDTSPSGLAQISGYADSPFTNNLATYVYGGDLLGNLWRFDINTTDPVAQVVLIATLKDSSNNPQPITTAPELALINSKRIIYVGTGKYLEISDLTTTMSTIPREL
jgi:type IV pilus assembly protein PilY1